MNRVDYESIVIQDIVNLQTNDELNLNPWYQRRAVWKTPQKAYLVNSIFESKPVPTIYIRHYLDVEKEKSIKEVVDGQQRIRSVLEYAANTYAAWHPNHAEKVTYDQLTPTERNSFKMTKLSVGYLIDANDADVIEIFGRLNSVAKTLNAQEKRNAAYSGEMKQFALREAASRIELWRTLNIFSATDVARMLEVQFISDLVLNMVDGLSDFSAGRLNKFYERFDEKFAKKKSIAKRLENVFGTIASLPVATIRDTIFSRSPILFSLLIILDSQKKTLPRRRIEDALINVDQMFNDDVELSDRPAKDADFILACTASTQRIKSRRVRDRYLRKALGVK